MMRGNLVFLMMVCFSGASYAQDVKTSIFGIEINEKLSMSECEIRMTNLSIERGATKEPHASYNRFAKDAVCYARQENIGTSVPIIEETVSVRFPLKQQPEISANDYISVRLVDGVVQRVWFWTSGLSAQARDFDLLTKKFGVATTVHKQKLQNGLGAVFESIEAAWVLKNRVNVKYSGVEDEVTRGVVVVATQKGEESFNAVIKAIINKGTKL